MIGAGSGTAIGGEGRRLRIALAIVCAVLLLAMMALTMADVLGRYLMNAPVPGAIELTEMLLAAIVFIGLPAAGLDGEHITVDLLTERMRGWVLAIQKGVIAVISGVVLLVVAQRLWKIGDQIASYSGTTPTLKLPLAPLAYGVAVLCALAALATLWQALMERKSHG